ncbi:MAG: hypothetical protein ACK5KO_04695 [Arachnia sp.]
MHLIDNAALLHLTATTPPVAPAGPRHRCRPADPGRDRDLITQLT